jgi:uncharacterized protein (TIGR02594 family)
MNEAPRWYVTASQELGVSEIVGLDNNRRILEYHSCTSLLAQTDEVPWCSSFVNWCMKQSMIRGTHSAAARSWLSWGYECEPTVGCVVILERGSNANSGHVGFLVEDDGPFIHLLGGNQGNKVSVAKFAKNKVLGYRWPFKVSK